MLMIRYVSIPLILLMSGSASFGRPLSAPQAWEHVSPDTIPSVFPPAGSPTPRAFGDTLPYVVPGPSSLNIPYDTNTVASEREHQQPVGQELPARTDLLGRDFTRSGSISRGFLVGSNRDATVVSGFRLQFSGPLTEEINVDAALTDENSPIQPEGTTQALREVDKVAIELSGPTFGLTLGDFFLERTRRSGGEFGPLSRKLQGIKGEVKTGFPFLKTNIGVVAASSRAVYHTLVIKGIEGVQGPYRLTGKSGERYLVVIAGSEKVSINGREMVRGESNDYVIDYATGEITFTTRNMITADSRIYVDFEYAERNYARNVIGTNVTAVSRGGVFEARFSVIQEADDPDNPVGGALDAATIELLRTSGEDRWKASVSAVQFVGNDSATGVGLGQYALRDSVIGGTIYQVLVYAPGTPDAEYVAGFSRVEQVPSDSIGYRRVRGGEYTVAGVGIGTHVPRTFVEPPRLQRNIDAGLRVRAGDFSVTAEGSKSILDRNRLSVVDPVADDAGAYLLGLSYERSSLSSIGLDSGRIRLDLDQRYVAEDYATFGRKDPVEYERDWDITGAEASEFRRRARVQFAPWREVQVEAFLGNLSRAGGIESNRTSAGIQVDDLRGLDVQASAEKVRRTDDGLGNGALWKRYSGGVGYRTLLGRPSLNIAHEDRRENPDSSSGLLEGSFRYTDVSSRFTTSIMRGWDAEAEGGWRSEDSSVGGVLSHAFVATGGGVRTRIGGGGSSSFSLEIQTRKTDFEKAFRVRGNQDTRTTLVRSEGSTRFLRNAISSRALYEFSSQRSSRLERVFVRVTRGTGQYSYEGDLNTNGIADEEEFVPVRYDGDYALLLVPGEDLVPVHAVKASWRLRFEPRQLGLSGVFSRLSSETYLRVEEKSTSGSTSSIAFLDLPSFLSPSTTIAGQQLLTNDIYFNRSDPDFSVRFRVTESRALTQLVLAPIASYGNERSIRVQGRLADDVTSQSDVFVIRDRSLGDAVLVRNRDLVRTGGTTDLGYRVDRNWETGLTLGLSRTENLALLMTGIADLNEQAVRVTYGVPSRGTVRAEVRREEITISNAPSGLPIPYEMTGGRAVGRSWFMELRVDLRLTDVIQVSGSYLGRSENAAPIIHTARVEARAVF